MAQWFNEIRRDMGNIIPAIDYYEKELDQARVECSLKGSVERHSRDMPGIVEYRFNQLQEIEAILEYLNIELRKIKTEKYKKFLEHYNRALSSRDAEKYVDGEDEVIDFETLINEVALMRNRYLGIMKGLDTKQWQMGHIVRLRTAGMEDIEI